VTKPLSISSLLWAEKTLRARWSGAASGGKFGVFLGKLGIEHTINLASTFLRVDAQWVTAKKDWQEAKRRYKMNNKSKTPAEAPVDAAADSAPYEAHMDEMRCILYAHGGTYDCLLRFCS
jgi:hypothetical protein